MDHFIHDAKDRILYVTVINHYGRETIRPECELSRKFCDLLRQKTLTRFDVNRIKELGYIIKIKEETL